MKFSYGGIIGFVIDRYNAVNGNYTYDGNGNMTYDVSKGFTISYNLLNLPRQVSCINDYALYTWDASGAKLDKTVYGSTAGNTTRYDYSGNFLYEMMSMFSKTPIGMINLYMRIP